MLASSTTTSYYREAVIRFYLQPFFFHQISLFSFFTFLNRRTTDMELLFQGRQAPFLHSNLIPQPATQFKQTDATRTQFSSSVFFTRLCSDVSHRLCGRFGLSFPAFGWNAFKLGGLKQYHCTGTCRHPVQPRLAGFAPVHSGLVHS